ncbi:histidine phosphatase family protein [Pseudonocardia sp.]|uniref:histidine phosphatase family protein n=1 Tax=Pseudonocardia sp. TaxID=60912 RepID=UPI002632F603|nr:histidine phosphatase family protein [Pseudonocardia sp.]MCU1629688.1 histidine phosphatase family protein [Pseudonocardia sp.]MDT7699223.1 glucosyl-3-phosphoglycerate phosphatase [Pseudonocardiales bacterium]HEV7469001.1 histidine phosphatase family protein [Pseudonocardia sp.]
MSLRRVVLLRHGQTDYNVAGRMQGHLDSHLTEEGREQARRAAPVIARMSLDRMISSDLTRAVDTAEEVSTASGLAVKLDQRLRETHLGEWQGRSVGEVEVDYPGAITEWRGDPRWTPPGGESRVDVVRRSLPVVEEIDEEYADEVGEQSLLLVAHGGMIAGMVCGLLDLPESTWPIIGGMGNCKWAVVARRADHPRWRLSGYNIGVS